jgi:peroxiredoxin
VALAIFALFSAWITERAKRLDSLDNTGGNTSSLIGSRAPDFTLSALDGRPVRLSDYRNQKTVVLSFWASWCGPCRMEMPSLEAFYSKNRDSVEVLAVSIDQDPTAARRYAEENKLPFTVLLDNNQQASGRYGVSGIPMLFVVDRTGNVKFSQEGLNPALEGVLTAEIHMETGTRNGR